MKTVYGSSVILLLALSRVVAFSVSRQLVGLDTRRSSSERWTSTCLLAEESEGGAENEQEASSSSDGATDILNSPAFLTRKLDVLKSDIAKAEADIEEAKARLEEGKAEWGPQLDELQKEYKNIQERLNTQGKSSDSQATMQVARQILEVLDNYDRAFGVVKAETDEEKAVEAAYRESYDQILDIFGDLGIEKIETVGVEFDYEFHQAVMQMPSEEYEEGIVCEEFQKGFKIGDTLIRAAMVAVAA